MDTGFLTSCMGDATLEDIIGWSAEAGIRQLEISLRHLGENTPERDESIKAALHTGSVDVSGIAHYDGNLLADPVQAIEALKTSVDRCARIGTDVLCVLTGLPVEGLTKEESIDGPIVEVFCPVAEYAAENGIKLAFENWTATCIQHFEQWDRLLGRLPYDNVGFNYDPSHLLWQGIDYLAGVETYGDRIFHTHAKDTEIRDDVVRRVGNQSRGWWRYCIPGQGQVLWGEFIARLRRVGYDGVLSIEHEDGFIGKKEGILLGCKYLEQFI